MPAAGGRTVEGQSTRQMKHEYAQAEGSKAKGLDRLEVCVLSSVIGYLGSTSHGSAFERGAECPEQTT